MAGFFSKEARVARKGAKAEVRLKKYEGAVNKAAGTQPPKFLSWRAISALFYLCEYLLAALVRNVGPALELSVQLS